MEVWAVTKDGFLLEKINKISTSGEYICINDKIFEKYEDTVIAGIVYKEIKSLITDGYNSIKHYYGLIRRNDRIVYQFPQSI